MDITSELDVDGISRYQKSIRMLRWEIELGRININIGVSFIPQQLFSPREGYLDAIYQISRYLQVKLKENIGRIVFDGTINQS